MEKRLTKAYHIILVIGICVFVFVVLRTGNVVMEKVSGTEAAILNDQMEIDSSSTSVSATGILPDTEMNGEVLAFFSKHAIVEVRIAGERVYCVSPAENSMVATTGYLWNIIHMREEYKGRPFQITMHGVYGNKADLNQVYYGSQMSILGSILKKDGFDILIACVIALIGLVFVLYVLFLYCTKKTDYSLGHLAIFTVLFGIWNITDSQAVSLTVRHPIALNTVNHICLMVMTIPFVMFLRSIYQEKHDRLWSAFCYFNGLAAVVRMVLQVFGIRDFKETLVLTHVVLVVFFVVVLYANTMELVNNKHSIEIRINTICIFFVIAMCAVDLVNYRMSKNGSFFSSLGYLTYIVVMGIFSALRTQKMMEKMQEAEVYRKLAYTDELTGLFNRTAYQRDMENKKIINKENGMETILPTTVLMIDLNDLKHCNDTFGHSYGDQYISMVAKEMKEVFGMSGRCYRIGGDEFSVLFSEPEKTDVQGMVQRFQRRLHDLNRNPFVVNISAAVGVASYETDLDRSLEETKDRADKMMYENKQKQKQERRAL